MLIEKKNKKTIKFGDVIFVTSLITWPIICFILGYVMVNLRTLVLAFQKYDVGTMTYSFCGFDNFAKFLKDIAEDSKVIISIKNSAINYFAHLLFMPISIFVSNALYKKVVGTATYRVILFLPHIVGSIVWIVMYKYLVLYGYPMVFGAVEIGILDHPDTQFVTILVFNLWIAFAGNMVLYSGAMGRIPYELVESANLDGIGPIREFVSITVPLIFPTITVFLVTGVISFFTANMHLFSFFGEAADLKSYNLGYYFFIQVYGEKSDTALYPYATAAGLVFTLVATPITFLIKHLLEKYGPCAEY